MGKMRNAHKITVGKCERKKNNSEDLGIDGNIILGWILGKQGGKLWTGLIWVRIGTSAEILWTRNEP
jgi:hypothetical protein